MTEHTLIAKECRTGAWMEEENIYKNEWEEKIQKQLVHILTEEHIITPQEQLRFLALLQEG